MDWNHLKQVAWTTLLEGVLLFAILYASTR
jgi:hypothetical protein